MKPIGDLGEGIVAWQRLMRLKPLPPAATANAHSLPVRSEVSFRSWLLVLKNDYGNWARQLCRNPIPHMSPSPNAIPGYPPHAARRFYPSTLWSEHRSSFLTLSTRSGPARVRLICTALKIGSVAVENAP
jgi:hypothetical protein